MLTWQKDLDAFFAQHDIPNNRVAMFYQDMTAVATLAKYDMCLSSCAAYGVDPSRCKHKNNYEFSFRDYYMGAPKLPTKRRAG